jgi:hypothetical protein
MMQVRDTMARAGTKCAEMERRDRRGCWYPPPRLGKQVEKTVGCRVFLKLALLLLYTSTNVLLQF